MVQKLRHLWGRVEIRVLVLLVFGFLLAGLALALAQTLKASSSESPFPTVSTWDDLIKQYLDFRQHNYALVVPGWYISYGQTEAILKEFGLEELQKEPDWYWTFNEGVCVFEDDSPLAKLVKHGAQIVIYEDMAKEELVVLSAPEKEGGEWREEIVYTAPKCPDVQKGEDYEQYLFRELSQRRIVWQMTLKSKTLAEQEAAALEAAQSQQEDSGEGGGMRLMMGMEEASNHLWLAIDTAAQGLGPDEIRLTVHWPDGFTNRLEIYSFDPVETNGFNGLGNLWQLAATNLTTEGETELTWTDEGQMDRVSVADCTSRFYAVGNVDLDTDSDGINDSRELFIIKTSPSNADTDGDGASDGDEIANSTNPLNNPGDSDNDGLSDDLEIVLGTDPDVADTDQDWAGDGYERDVGFDPLNVSNTPPLFLEIDSRAPLTRTTNLVVSFPGLVGGNAIIGETTDLVDGVLFDLATNIAYGLQSELNGNRQIYARLYRNTVEQSPLISGSIVFDNIAPTIGNLLPTDGSSTNSRWIKITGSVTDAASTVRAFVNGEWSDGVSRGQFQYDRYMLDAGTNRIEITAEDLAGNIATQYLEVIQDTAGDTNAPTIALELPNDYIINGGVTNWLSQTTFGSNDTLYLKGITDDQTADVRFMVTAEGETNGPFDAVVVGTQVWGEVVLFPGTNSLVVLASDAAGNAFTGGYTVVRDTNFFFVITNPAPYRVMNCPSTLVSGIASPEFVSATITVNGQPVQITNQGSIVTFSTVSPVPLNLGRTELTATADLNGRSYYADPVAYGYDVLEWRQTVSQTWDMQYWWGTAEYVNNVGWQYEEDAWNATNRTRRLTNAWSNLAYEYDLRMPWRNGCFPSSGHAQEQTYRASYYEFVPKFPYNISPYTAYYSAYNRNMLFSELSAQSYGDDTQWIEDGWGNGWWYTLHCWDNYTVDISNEVRFIKRWPKQEDQMVVFHFKNLGYNSGTLDPSAITYKRQTGFWFRGDVAFLVPLKTETEYTISKSDFTWPASFGTWSQTHVLSMDALLTNAQVLARINEPDGLPIQPIARPDTRFRKTGPWCFEWQYVHPDNVVIAYTQTIEGLVQPLDAPFGYHWTVSQGTLSGADTATPIFDASSMSLPSTMTTVDLELRAVADVNTTLKTNRTLEVYRDHLERDFQNFGTGIECGAPTNSFYWSFSRYGTDIWCSHPWNCFGSVWHAYDGTHDGAINDSVPTDGFSVSTYDDPIPWSTALSGLGRGDIVSFYRYDSGTGIETWQHAHTCMGSASEMYGANNQPLYGFFGRSDSHGHYFVWEGGSFKWWTTSSQTYYDQMNAGFQSIHPGAGLLINRIKVHRR